MKIFTGQKNFLPSPAIFILEKEFMEKNFTNAVKVAISSSSTQNINNYNIIIITLVKISTYYYSALQACGLPKISLINWQSSNFLVGNSMPYPPSPHLWLKYLHSLHSTCGWTQWNAHPLQSHPFTVLMILLMTSCGKDHPTVIGLKSNFSRKLWNKVQMCKYFTCSQMNH